jgi:2-polyprenyl-3-methyl-5-hydroxy-6-metoxy-1,4-benzoquinol methylase
LRPFTGPLDGRVADINRRLTDAQRSVGQHSAAIEEKLEAVKGELGAYTAAATESNAYVGAELRRFEEFLQELHDNADRQQKRLGKRIESLGHSGYVERLDHAANVPLERLDGAAANLINHAGGHRGFAAQAGLWFNPPVTVELDEGNARLAGVNERIVEIPFAMRALGRLEPPARILDIGAAESTFSLSAASMGYRVTALDLHPLPYSHPRLESTVGRFEDWDAGAERFDAVFLISTIEHVGLGAYGEPIGNGDADLALMNRVRDELLSEQGFVVLTTPYGAAHQDALERTYDDASLARLLDGWTPLERRVVMRSDKRTWLTVEGDASDDARGVVMALAVPARHS